MKFHSNLIACAFSVFSVKIHGKLMHTITCTVLLFAVKQNRQISAFHSTGGTLSFLFLVNIVLIYSIKIRISVRVSVSVSVSIT